MLDYTDEEMQEVAEQLVGVIDDENKIVELITELYFLLDETKDKIAVKKNIS